MPDFNPVQQREFAVQVVRQLRASGFEALWAGGCVRDRLLGRAPKDYDVGTTATPEQIREVFGRRRTVPVGAQFGVMTVVGPPGAGHVEVATFRRDTTYSDGRHPDAVEYSTPEADAQRRDFTINGLFYDPLDDRVIDYVGGVDDLGRGIVRAIGDPVARFTEDKLRLLRAVRFAATFAFQLDVPTRQAVERMADQLHVVSVERIAAELRLMLVHRGRAAAIDLLRETGLLEQVLPELAAANQQDQQTAVGRAGDEAWLAALEVLDALAEPGFPLALAALLHPFVDAPSGVAIGRRWKLSNDEIKRVEWLLARQDELADAENQPWSRLQPVLVAAGGKDLVALARARVIAAGAPLVDMEFCEAKLAEPPDVLDPPPILSGDDLIAHGVRPGKLFQKLLQAVRDAQLDGQVHSKAESLALVDRLRD